MIAGIAVLNREAFITCVCTNDKYVKELNKPTLVNAKKNNSGKFSKITFLCLIISLKVNGNKINQTKVHRKKTKVIGGMLEKKANLPTIKLPAQNNVAHTSMMYALVFCI